MSEISELVDAWIQPLDGNPSGQDLEYDNDFLELSKAAEGKPETQFSAAEPPNWSEVADLSRAIFERTRDLRVCMYWARAQLHLVGLRALPEVLRLTKGLLSEQWETLHPQLDPDDGDAYGRLNVLAQWEDYNLALGDVRTSKVFASRSVGQLTVRDVEVALERLAARDDESPMSVGTVEQMLQAAVDEDSSLALIPQQATQRLQELLDLVEGQVGYGRAPSCDDLKSILSALEKLMPVSTGDDAFLSSLSDEFSDDVDEDIVVRAHVKSSRGSSGVGSITTRADAIKAIEMVCAYLEDAEPTSPAQLLLRRAQKLIDKSFIELIRELAPEALSEVGKIMGVDTSSSAYDD